MAKLSIAGDSGKNKLYEKEYTLKTKQVEAKKSSNMYMITDNVVIDYDYYNSLANKFKSTYGVDASSQLDIFVKVKKAVTNEANEINLNDTKQMTLSFPLTQKTLNITINDTGINNSQNIVSESKVSFGNVAFGIIGFIIFVGAVACLLSFLELVIKTVPKTSKYDRYIKKIIKEYDRLIVETPSEPRLEDKEIIKITRFEELLDVRDNLKRPIMHYTLIKHQKCYFYVESENRIYLLSIKAVDIEKNK